MCSATVKVGSGVRPRVVGRRRSDRALLVCPARRSKVARRRVDSGGRILSLAPRCSRSPAGAAARRGEFGQNRPRPVAEHACCACPGDGDRRRRTLAVRAWQRSFAWQGDSACGPVCPHCGFHRTRNDNCSTSTVREGHGRQFIRLRWSLFARSSAGLESVPVRGSADYR